jgi:hypothetical protein
MIPRRFLKTAYSKEGATEILFVAAALVIITMLIVWRQSIGKRRSVRRGQIRESERESERVATTYLNVFLIISELQREDQISHYQQKYICDRTKAMQIVIEKHNTDEKGRLVKRCRNLRAALNALLADPA